MKLGEKPKVPTVHVLVREVFGKKFVASKNITLYNKKLEEVYPYIETVCKTVVEGSK